MSPFGSCAKPPVAGIPAQKKGSYDPFSILNSKKYLRVLTLREVLQRTRE
jgi:hypothetical protein